MTGSAALQDVAETLRSEGGLLAAAILDPAPDAATPFGDAVGERYAFVVEAIREGHLVHSGSARIVREDDRDLGLLAGDRLYALGLDRLAAAGDLEAVKVLARVIARCSEAQATGDDSLADSAWAEGIAALTIH